jgi:hypothetical protein
MTRRPGKQQEPRTQSGRVIAREEGMSVTREVLDTALECIRTPGHRSVWSERLGKYVCDTEPDFQATIAEPESVKAKSAHPPISDAFKLVFLTAAGGTLLFVIICVVTTIAAGKDPPPLLDKTVTSLFDLAKIGFGVIVGLLGAQHIRP